MEENILVSTCKIRNMAMDCFYKIMVNYIKDTGAMAKLMA